MTRRIFALSLFVILLCVGQVVAQTPTAQTKVDFALTGNNTVIAGVTNRSVQVYAIWLVVDADTTVTFKDGTSTALSGAAALKAGGSVVLDPQGMPWFATSAGNAFVISQSGTAQISGRVYYLVQ